MNTFKFAVLFAAFIGVALAAPAVQEQEVDDGQTSVITIEELPETIKQLAIAALASQAGSGGSDDDIVTTLTDIVNTLTTINGMNSIGVDDTEVVNTAVGMGEVEVIVGSSGDTVKTELGDLTNVVGAIQGFWYNYDIANVNVGLNRDDDQVDPEGSADIDDGSAVVVSN